MKDNFWKAFAELSKEQQKDAREFLPNDHASHLFHFDGVTLSMACGDGKYKFKRTTVF